MRSDWASLTASDLEAAGVLLIQDGNHGAYRPRRDEIVAEGTPHIRAADISDAGTIDFDNAQRISDTALGRIHKGVGARGDVLLTHKGTVGRVGRVPPDAPHFVCSPQTTFWRSLNEDHLDQTFLFAYLRSPLFAGQLRARMNESDMAPYVSLTAQRSLSVLVPPIAEQRRIASVLRPIDDKADSTRRIDATLRQLVQAATNLLLLSPAAESHLLSDLFDLTVGGVWGEDHATDKASVEARVLRGVDVAALVRGLESKAPLRWITPKQLESRKLAPGEIVVEGSGECGRSAVWLDALSSLYDEPVVYTNFCKRLRPRTSLPVAAALWVQLQQKKESGELDAFKTGTAMPNLDARAMLNGVRVMVPPRTDAENLFGLVSAAFDGRLVRERRTLAAIRDALLPALVSGRIEVPDESEGDGREV